MNGSGYAMPMMFAPNAFHFLKPSFDEANVTARLPYRFDDGPVMTEQIRFPGARLPLDNERREALHGALHHLHLAAGVSYYKAGVPSQLVCEGGGPAPETAAFFEKFYQQGLAEFAYRNELFLKGRLQFRRNSARHSSAHGLDLGRHAVVPLGGGKDSLVALELMRQSGREFSTVAVGQSTLIAAVAERAGVRHIRIERCLAPELMVLNERGAYNGHVPITGVIAFILVCAAILYDFNTVVMANERSSSSGNLRLPGGEEVNHQYSKSLEFEADFADYCKAHILAGFNYFSLLRPWSELRIGKAFSGLDSYFDVFSSCNSNFSLSRPGPQGRWCRDCPKCRFVFLCLAPFMNPERLIKIFGANLLDDPSQQAGFDELIGRGAHKPFECVGEVEESQAAFVMLTRQPAWQDDYLVRRFADQMPASSKDTDGLIEAVLAADERHRVPDKFLKLLNET